MSSIAISFKNLAIGLAAIGLAVGAAFGAGIAYGRTDDTSGTTSNTGFPNIGAIGASGAGGGNAGGGLGGIQALLGAMGEITAIDGDTITIQTAQGSQEIHVDETTVIRVLQSAALTDLTEGDVIAYSGDARDDGSTDATAIDEVASQLQSLVLGLPGGGGAGFPGSGGGGAPGESTGESGGTGGTGLNLPASQTPAVGGSEQPTVPAGSTNGTPTTGETPAGSNVAPPQTGEGLGLPDRNSCDEIRGTEYRSATEREFFLANCISN